MEHQNACAHPNMQSAFQTHKGFKSIKKGRELNVVDNKKKRKKEGKMARQRGVISGQNKVQVGRRGQHQRVCM